jgi:hypothetical protein
MMSLPVALDPRHEEGVITCVLEKGWLLKTRQVDTPGFMKEIGEVQGSLIRPSALTSEEILSHSINHIIHPSPPIKGLHSLLSLVAADPFPVDVNRKRFNSVVNDLKIVKARLRHGQAGGLGSFPQGSLAIKGNGKRA